MLEIYQFVEQAIAVSIFFERDREFVVRDGEIVIVDEFTQCRITGHDDERLLFPHGPRDRSHPGVADEIEILNSRRLMERVVKDLDLNIQYFKEGNVNLNKTNAVICHGLKDFK